VEWFVVVHADDGYVGHKILDLSTWTQEEDMFVLVLRGWE
jgi:hypothetical protein